MKKTIFIILLIFIFSACGQMPKGPNKDSYINTKSEKHINIPSTRIFIIPPIDFKISETFIGMKKDGKSALKIYDLNEGNYYDNAKKMSRKAFENQGIKVIEYKELLINNYPAKYTILQADDNSKTINLIFGDSTFSAMLMAITLINENETFKSLEESIKSVYYDKKQKVDLVETKKSSLMKVNQYLNSQNILLEIICIQ